MILTTCVRPCYFLQQYATTSILKFGCASCLKYTKEKLTINSRWQQAFKWVDRILPSSNSTSFNTVLFFVIAGASLACGQNGWCVRFRQIAAIFLIAGASLILYEDIFDVALGIDWVALHQTVKDGSPRPGRVAPNTCICFILLGIACDTNLRRCRLVNRSEAFF